MAVASPCVAERPICGRRRGPAEESDCDRAACAGARCAASRAADYRGPLHVVVRACRGPQGRSNQARPPRAPVPPAPSCPRAPAAPLPASPLGAVRVVRTAFEAQTNAATSPCARAHRAWPAGWGLVGRDAGLGRWDTQGSAGAGAAVQQPQCRAGLTLVFLGPYLGLTVLPYSYLGLAAHFHWLRNLEVPQAICTFSHSSAVPQSTASQAVAIGNCPESVRSAMAPMSPEHLRLPCACACLRPAPASAPAPAPSSAHHLLHLQVARDSSAARDSCCCPCCSVQGHGVVRRRRGLLARSPGLGCVVAGAACVVAGAGRSASDLRRVTGSPPAPAAKPLGRPASPSTACAKAVAPVENGQQLVLPRDRGTPRSLRATWGLGEFRRRSAAAGRPMETVKPRNRLRKSSAGVPQPMEMGGLTLVLPWSYLGLTLVLLGRGRSHPRSTDFYSIYI